MSVQGPDLDLDVAFLPQDLGSGQFEMFGAVGVELEAHTAGQWLAHHPSPRVRVCASLALRGSFIHCFTHSFIQQILLDQGPGWLGLWGHAVGQSLSTTDLVVLQRMWMGAFCFLECARPCLQCSPLEPRRAGLTARQRGVQGCLQRPGSLPQVPRLLRGRLKPNLTDG